MQKKNVDDVFDNHVDLMLLNVVDVVKTINVANN